jgi:hypothetical protein
MSLRSRATVPLTGKSTAETVHAEKSLIPKQETLL